MAGLESAYLGGQSIATCFDLITGTSTGGIIGLGLGAGLTATKLLGIYMERGGEVFPDHGWLAKKALGAAQLFVNRCDRAKLDSLIDKVVGGRQLWESHKRLCIPAAETRHFEPFVFKTPHHPDYILDWREPMAHVAKTTSAAPSYFRPITVKDGFEFVDGGVWANNPIMVGVSDALACFSIKREQLKVLSLGCVPDEFEMGWGRRNFGGLFFWRSLMFEAMHLQSHSAVGQARLIAGGDRIVRVDTAPILPKIELSDWARCRDILPEKGRELVVQCGPTTAEQFFSAPAARYVPHFTPDTSARA